ncbi:uncharacterized protein LOC143884948 [Tasmannia lanceolata]|uniref:uncharacterized protein LOC143884948 n=1 Tax=Tasmannia lanceolata TaxID=3420 RepID=UPI004064C09F
MEGPPWSYQLTSLDELKHSLLCTTLELESIQMSVKDESKRSEEKMNQLLQLLKLTFEERDEAKCQLQRLLNKLSQSSTTQIYNSLPNPQPENPTIRTIKGNSSITESNSLSETYNHHSYVSASPVDSFFDGVYNIELHNLPIIDKYAMMKPLPEKGKLLQAVMGAGPLLQTLLIAGPLPQWQNPPPIQLSQIPSVSIKGNDNAAYTPNPIVNPNFLV